MSKISLYLSKDNIFVGALVRIIVTTSYTSICVLFSKKIYSRYYSFELWLNRAVNGSQIYKSINILREEARVNFKNSFLGRITELGQKYDSVILDNSRFVKLSMNLIKEYKYKMSNYLGTSAINISIMKLNNGFRQFSIKTTSKIMIVVILTNVIFSILLRNEINLLGWFMRGLLLFIAINGLYSDVAWEELIKTSYLINRLNNSCKP